MQEYRDGDRRFGYVRRNGQWVPEGAAAPAMPMGIPTKPADPRLPVQFEREQIGVQSDRRGLEETNLDIEAKRRAPAKEAFDRDEALRKEFLGRPEVQNFGTILPQFGSAVQAGDNGAGDLQLIYSFGKIMDPGSVVREGELEIAQGTGSMGEQLKGLFRSVSRGGRLTPEIRQQLLNEIRTRGSAAADAYNLTREDYKGRAEQYGADPFLVVGTHPALPFQQAEADFLGRPVRNLDGSQGAAPRRREPPQGLAVDVTDDGDYDLDGKSDEPKGVGDITLGQLGSSALNTLAGVGQGAASIVDIPTRALGATMGVVADSIPGVPEWLSDSLKNPFTIGGAIESAVPTTSAPGGALARFGGEMVGGAAAMPAAATETVVNRLIGQVPKGFVPRVNAAEQVDAARAAQSLGIRMPRFVAGGASAQNMGRRLEQTPFGRATIQRGADDMIADAQIARDRIADRAGGVVEPVGMGERAIGGAKKTLSAFSRRSSRDYDRAEKLTGNTRVQLSGASQEVDRQIAELADTPGVVPKMLDTLQGIKGRMGGDWSPAGIRRMRTILTDQFVESGMQRGDASRRAKLITEAAENDLIAGLSAAGKPAAAKAWQQASANYRAQQRVIEDVFTPILGANSDKSAEEVSRALIAAAKGNGGRMQQLLQNIPAEDAGAIRASIINQLGRSNSGQQTAAGDAFSLDTFLTHWDQIKGAREKLFDPETLGGLNQLAKVAERAKATNRARNTSNTGADVWAVGTGIPALVAGAGGTASSGAGTGALTATIALAATALAQHGGARLLASPNFARRLAQTPANPRAAAKFWSAPWVQQMARSQPAIANDLTGFQSTLLRAMNDNLPQAGRVAAESPNQRPDNPNQRR